MKKPEKLSKSHEPEYRKEAKRQQTRSLRRWGKRTCCAIDADAEPGPAKRCTQGTA